MTCLLITTTVNLSYTIIETNFKSLYHHLKGMLASICDWFLLKISTPIFKPFLTQASSSYAPCRVFSGRPVPLIPQDPWVMQRARCDTEPVHGLSACLHCIVQPEEEPTHNKTATSTGTMSAVKEVKCLTMYLPQVLNVYCFQQIHLGDNQNHKITAFNACLINFGYNKLS